MQSSRRECVRFSGRVDSEPPVGAHDRCVFWMVVGTLT